MSAPHSKGRQFTGVAKVLSTGTYGEYDIDVHRTDGMIVGDIVVNLPYLGHAGDRVLVRSTDMSGSHTMETVCSEVDGRLFLSVETSPLSRCQILSVVDETDGPLPAYVVQIAGAGMVLTIAGWKMTGKLEGLGIMLVGIIFLLTALFVYNAPYRK